MGNATSKVERHLNSLSDGQTGNSVDSTKAVLLLTADEEVLQGLSLPWSCNIFLKNYNFLFPNHILQWIVKKNQTARLKALNNVWIKENILYCCSQLIKASWHCCTSRPESLVFSISSLYVSISTWTSMAKLNLTMRVRTWKYIWYQHWQLMNTAPILNIKILHYTIFEPVYNTMNKHISDY